MATRGLRAVLLGAAALAASPAGALGDLTGEFSGKLTCESTDPAGSSRTTIDAALYLDDDGARNAYVYINNTLLYFRTAVVFGPEKPDQGRIGGPDCNISPTTGGSLIQAVAKARPGSEKASLKGEFITLGVGTNPHAVQVCRFKLKRTTTTLSQPIPDCPL